MMTEEEEDICPYCNKNAIDIDDYGLMCCNQCWEAHPEWRAKMRTCISNDASINFGYVD